MKIARSGMLAAALAAAFSGAPQGAAGADGDLVREALRQQSVAERAGCAGVQRTLASGADAALVVRTAVELGYNACEVIRCALDGKADLAGVVRGAAAAGVGEDIVSRCALDAGADPAAVAATLADLLFEPNYCYFAPRPAGTPGLLAPLPPVIDRAVPRPQASPFTF